VISGSAGFSTIERLPGSGGLNVVPFGDAFAAYSASAFDAEEEAVAAVRRPEATQTVVGTGGTTCGTVTMPAGEFASGI
jgi:hypothetical protein